MIEKLSARENAYQLLRSRILKLDLKPNDSLNDKELAEEMGLSRTPIHEAIIMLSLANLVVVRPQSGTFVAPINIELVEWERFTGYTVEKEMILRAVHHMTDEARQIYEDNLQLYKFYLNAHMPDRRTRLFTLDNQFHRIAFQVNHKEHIFDLAQNTRHHIERIQWLSFLMDLEDTTLKDHIGIAAAIAEKDASKALQLLEQHYLHMQEHLPKMKETYPQYFQLA